MEDGPSMRREPGTYILILRADREETIQVGSIGLLQMRPGEYAYVGSAFGPGGLLARVQRHVENQGAQHWHVDYLRPLTTVESIWFTHDENRRECSWARTLRSFSGATVPLAGVGASDCDCLSHFVDVPEGVSVSDFREQIHSDISGHATIRQVPPEAVRSS